MKNLSRKIISHPMPSLFCSDGLPLYTAAVNKKINQKILKIVVGNIRWIIQENLEHEKFTQ